MKRATPLHCNTCIFIRKSYLCRLCSLVTESCVSLLPKSVHYCYQNLSTPDYRNLCTSRYRLQHFLFEYASSRFGECLVQRDSEQRTAGNICESVVILQEFQQGDQFRVCLNFVKKDQSIRFCPDFFSCNRAQLQIEVFWRSQIFKKPFPVLVFQKVEFNVILKEFLPLMPDNK